MDAAASHSSPLNALTFCSRDIGEGDGFDVYRDIYSAGSDVERIEGRFVATFQGFCFPQMMIMERELSGVSHQRTRKRVATDGFNHVNLQLVTSGRMMLSTGDTPRIVEAGQIALFDMTRPQRTWTVGAKVIAASLNRDQIIKMLPSGIPLHGLVLPAASGGLLGDMMRALVRAGPEIDTHLAHAATASLALLLGASVGAVTGHALEAPLQALAKREQAAAYIETAFGRLDLSSDMIANAVGVSRSVLYRLFEPLGGVAHYILQRRLVALRRALARLGETRSFAVLAQACGFVSASHAGRCFKDAFGMTPGEYRALAHRPEAAQPRAGESYRDTMARWLVDLQ